MENKLFTCGCERCLDPTELGSHVSSHKCPDDKCQGDVLPSDPLSMKKDWVCSSCRTVVKAETVIDLLKTLVRETSQAERQNIKETKRLLNKYSAKLHK